MKKRIISLILAIAVLFSFASCDLWTDKGKNDNVQNPPDNDFTVETETVEYSEKDVTEATERVVALVSAFADILGYGKHFDIDRRASLGNTVSTKVVPALIDVGVYPEEFFSLIDCADETVAFYTSETEDEVNPKIISDLYTRFISVIDVNRLGALLYELIMIRLDSELLAAKEKYENKDSKLNLEKYEYYTALVGKASELGRGKFTDAFSVIVFSASLFNSEADISDKGINLSVEDALEIMRKQGEKFAQMTLDAADWQVIAEVVENYLPESGSTVKGKLLISLDYADFFIESADVIPDIIGFYADKTANISKESIEIIKAGGEYAYELALVRELLSDRAALVEILTLLDEKIPEADTRCVTAINSYDKSGYDKFCESYGASIDGLILALEDFSASQSDESYLAMIDAAYGYFARINSVVTYVYLYT